MVEFWFKSKRYRWGWYPASWQGWLVMIGFVLLLGTGFAVLENTLEKKYILFFFIPYALLLILILLIICYKTGEKPRWRWG